MATRSYIGIKTKEGFAKVIYCHWDGYIKGGVGETLLKIYNTSKKVEKLINDGDHSCIAPSALSYKEMRGDHCPPQEMRLNKMDAEYNYLWDGKKWLYNTGERNNWVKL